MDEPPAQAMRLKKDSSMRVAVNLVKDGTAHAAVSAGNTGASRASASRSGVARVSPKWTAKARSTAGRVGRSWFSPKYKGIYASLILRPQILPAQSPILTLLSAVSRLFEYENGIIKIEDKPVLDYKSDELAKKLSILKQTNHTELNITVEQLVNFGRFPYSKGHLKQEDKDQVIDSPQEAYDKFEN